MKIKCIIACLLTASFALFLTGCGGSSKPTLKVAATSVPHGELLELVQPDLRDQNIELEILLIDDFNTPNRVLSDGDVDANFFQHLPFLESQKYDFGYAFEPLTAVHLEPMALYSKRHASVKEIKEGETIAIPGDPSNQARALALIEQSGLITLKQKGPKASVLDIQENPLHLKFVEMDSPLLSRSLDDADAAAISTNFALLGGLSPQKDVLMIESGHSPFANIVVIREGETHRPELQALKKALTSDKVRKYIEEKYRGAIIPASN